MKKKQILILLFSTAAASLALIPLLLSFTSRDGNIPGMGLQGTVFCAFWGAILYFILRQAWPFIAPYPTMLIGALMIAKVKLAPVLTFWKEKADPFPLFSETHLYFILPGAFLIALGFFMLLKSEEE